MNRLKRHRRVQVLNLLLEGNSIRGTSRLTGVSTRTILRLLLDAGNACKKFHDDLVNNIEVSERIELDELWNFIYTKQKNLLHCINPPKFAGDTWTYIALDSRTKLLVSCYVGKRTLGNTRRFLKDLKKRVGRNVELASDGYPAYTQASREIFGKNVSLANIVGLEKIRVSGNPDMDSAGTTFVERHNLTVRMSIRRYARQTNAFSKKIEYQRAHSHLYVTWYNWCRIHETLQVTPAMEAGLCDTLYGIEFIVDLIEEREPLPRKRGPYWKRH